MLANSTGIEDFKLNLMEGDGLKLPMGLTMQQEIILNSAKQTLAKLDFFGLTEYQRSTQYLFEKTFNVNFLTDFGTFQDTYSSSARKGISDEMLNNIENINNLDSILYQFGKSLFHKRLSDCVKEDLSDGRTLPDGLKKELVKLDISISNP